MSSSSAPKEMHRVGPYILGELLGEGASSKVKLAFHVDTAVQVAVKIVEKSAIEQNPSMGQKLEREIAVMKRLNHPNCVALFEVIDDPQGDRLFLVMEMLEGGEVMQTRNLPAGRCDWPCRAPCASRRRALS